MVDLRIILRKNGIRKEIEKACLTKKFYLVKLVGSVDALCIDRKTNDIRIYDPVNLPESDIKMVKMLNIGRNNN